MEDIPLFTVNDGGPRLCRVSDFARAHDVPAQTLYSAESTGRILGTRIRGKVYLNVESAEKFVAAYRKLTPSPKES